MKISALAVVAAVSLLAGPAAAAQKKGPVKVFILAGQSNMDGQADVRTIDFLGEDPDPAKAALLRKFKPEGSTLVRRDDVWVASDDVSGDLGPGYGGRKNYAKLGHCIGPEYAFGYFLGEASEKQVLLIKYAPGGQSLYQDFRSPSAGLPDPMPMKNGPNKSKVPMTAADFGGQYRGMVEYVHDVLKNLKRRFPSYDEKAGYEIVGFVWFQGFNDLVGGPRCIAEYDRNLVCLIKDVRKEFHAPNMKVVVGVIGVNGVKNETGKQKALRDAMRSMNAVPEFKGNVKAIETAPLLDPRVIALKTAGWLNKDRDLKKDPLTAEEKAMLGRATSNMGFHYYGEGRFFILLGKAMADAMLELTGGKDLDAAINNGDFAGYLADVSAWLGQKTPAKPDREALAALLVDPQFLTVLDQRQLISKVGATTLGKFAKAEAANGEFLSWLLNNSTAMELYLEAAVPISSKAREENAYTLNPRSLEIWKQIVQADPDARQGLCQKLAIATALAPPGSVNIGAGGASRPENPVVRYQYFKNAHQNKELFPSFDHLTVWEYTHVVSSGASDEDLTWARNMVNTFRPDLRADELVVNSTSLVWRRSAPPQFYVGGYGNFKNVLAGGGKCGPRSSWSQMVCHAFGIPAIGVGQPAHACVAYKAANPMTEPQPGSCWKVGFGRGWEVSHLLGMSGPEFMAGIAERAETAKFSQVEHLRWLAAAMVPGNRAAAIMDIAHAVQKSSAAMKTDLAASLKPEEADAEPGEAPAKGSATAAMAAPGVVSNFKSHAPVPPIAMSTVPLKAAGGVIHVEAAGFVQTGGQVSWDGQTPHVLVHDCFTGGKQVYFQQQMKSQWAAYTIDVPASGTYQIVMKAACVNIDQDLEVCSGGKIIATVPIPLSYGLWEETSPVGLKLEKGVQTLRIQTPTTELKRGIALRWFELKRQGE